MVLNIVLGGLLMLSVAALLACHHFGWLVDYVLRSPSRHTRFSASPSERTAFVRRDE